MRLAEDIAVLDHIAAGRFSFVAGPPARYVDAGCSWVLDRSVSGGGCLYLLGVHFTDIAPTRAAAAKSAAVFAEMIRI